MPRQFMRVSWWTKLHWDRVSPSASIFLCNNHFTNASCLFLSKSWLYQKDKRVKPGNLKKSNILLEVEEP